MKSFSVGFNLRVESNEFQSLTVLKGKVLCPVADLYVKGIFSILVVQLVMVALCIYLQNKESGAHSVIHLKAIIAWR